MYTPPSTKRKSVKRTSPFSRLMRYVDNSPISPLRPYSRMASLMRRGSPVAKASRFVRLTRQRQMRRNRKKYRYNSTLNTRAGGKFKLGKHKRMYMNKPIIKKSIGGYNRTLESSKILEGSETVWVGHSTCARLEIFRSAFIAMMFDILRKINLQTENVEEDEIIRGLGVGDTLLFTWAVASSATVTTTVYTVPAGQTTLLQIYNWFVDNGRPWNNSIDSRDVQFKELQIRTTERGYYTFSLRDYKVKGFVQSTLRVQNRCKVPAVGEDNQENVDVVDNCPVIGKSYTGVGSSLFHKKTYGVAAQNTFDQHSDQNYGVMLLDNASNCFQEPPQPNNFSNVKFSGSLRIQPGVIKTSQLRHPFTFYFNTIFQMAAPWANNAVPQPNLVGQRIRQFGSFRVFCIEKMLNVDPTFLVRIAFEHNLEISCKAFYKKNSPVILKSFRRQTLA